MTETANAWSKLGGPAQCANSEQADKLYSAWVEAGTYDDDVMNKLGCDRLKDDLVKKTISSISNDESAVILDLAAGTGIVAERLRMYGYKGTMHAVERNEAMMERAKDKGMYRKYIPFDIVPDEELPVEKGHYDAVTIVGAMSPNHLQPGCIKQAYKCLKPRGVLAFYTRNTEERKKYVSALVDILENMVKAGEITPIEVKEVNHYDTKNAICDVDGIMAMLYVYRKL